MTTSISARVLALLLAVLMLFALAGCGDDNDSGEAALNDITPDASESVSDADVSATDVSATDVSPSDAGGDLLYDLHNSQLYAMSDEATRGMLDLLADSTAAFNAEDIDAYMACVDPESPGYDSTKADTAELFDNYQLIATIDSFSVEKFNDAKGTATITVLQTTVRDGSEGKGFAPVQNYLSHDLVRRDGKWYFSATTVVSRYELTERWNMFIDFVNRKHDSTDDDVSYTDITIEEGVPLQQ